MKQYQLLKSIIDRELNEIDEEMATQDNSDISTLIAFHVEHGIRDAEQRKKDNEPTELEFPYGTSFELIKSMNDILLTTEVLLQYYYKSCYFGTKKEKVSYRNQLNSLLEKTLD